MPDTSLVFDILANDKTTAGLSSAKKRATIAFAAIGAAALAYGAIAVKAATEDAQGQATLANSLKNSTGARDSDVASVEDWIGKVTLATGVADDQLRPALATLARATGDVGKAQDLLSLAMDASAATGKDLGAVSTALAKAQNGNVGGLAKLGIATKDASGKTLSFQKVVEKMQGQFSGAQAAKTDTFAGKISVMQNSLDEATESVGYGLLPILTTLATFMVANVLPVIQSVTDWLGKNSNATMVLVGIVAVATAGIVAMNIATKIAAAAQAAWTIVTGIATAAQWAWNAAMTANPIGLVILAVVAFIAALVLLYKNSETVRNVIDAVWTGIKSAIGGVVSWFQNTAWPIISTVIGYIIGYYKTLWTVVSTVFTSIQGAISGVVSWFRDKAWPIISTVIGYIVGYYKTLGGAVKTVFDGIQGAISGVVNWFEDKAWPKIQKVGGWISGIWDSIGSAASGAFSGIGKVFRDAINSVIRIWNDLSLTFSLGPVSKTFDTPNIPYLADGGIVTRPTLAMIGEAGPEAVVPLNGRYGVGGGAQITVHVNGVNDPTAVRAAARQGAAEGYAIARRRIGVA